MNELQRQAYLSAMGVDVYYPRLQLVGAAASRQCEMPQAPVAQAGPEALIPPRDKSKTSASPFNVSELLDIPGRRQSAATAKTAPAATRPAVSSEVTPVFSLSVTVIKGRLLLVDDCPLELLNSREYQQLLHNIVFALGMGKQVIECRSFQWPEAMKGHHARDAAAAKQALQAHLSRQLDISAARYLLLMGESARQFAVNTELTEAELTPHDSAPVQVLATLSASRMLREPMLKRQLWQQLQALYKALKPS